MDTGFALDSFIHAPHPPQWETRSLGAALYLARAKDVGHHVKLLEKGVAWLRSVLLEQAKERHNNGSERDRAFSADSDKLLQEQYSKLVPDGRYYYAWMVVFAWAQPMVKVALASPQPPAPTAGLDVGHCVFGVLLAVPPLSIL